MVCLLCIYVSSYDCSQFAYLCLIVWLFMVCPLLMSNLMTVPNMSASYVSSYDCSQSAYLLCLILWLFPACLLLMTHLMIVPGLPIYVSSYDSSWSTHCLCLTLWLFLICLLRKSYLMIVPSLPTSGDCSQFHLMAIPCACYLFILFSRLGVCTVSEAQVDLWLLKISHIN